MKLGQLIFQEGRYWSGEQKKNFEFDRSSTLKEKENRRKKERQKQKNKNEKEEREEEEEKRNLKRQHCCDKHNRL